MTFDYDVVIIGSGFGGSVAALRAAEKGYRVGVMESGRRWKDEEIPKTQWHLPSFRRRFLRTKLRFHQPVSYAGRNLVLRSTGQPADFHRRRSSLEICIWQNRSMHRLSSHIDKPYSERLGMCPMR